MLSIAECFHFNHERPQLYQAKLHNMCKWYINSIESCRTVSKEGHRSWQQSKLHCNRIVKRLIHRDNRGEKVRMLRKVTAEDQTYYPILNAKWKRKECLMQQVCRFDDTVFVWFATTAPGCLINASVVYDAWHLPRILVWIEDPLST